MDPAAPGARLTIGDALQAVSESRSDRTKHLVDSVEADATNKVNVRGRLRGLTHEVEILVVFSVLMVRLAWDREPRQRGLTPI
jgi:hypothetical protein